MIMYSLLLIQIERREIDFELIDETHNRLRKRQEFELPSLFCEHVLIIQFSYEMEADKQLEEDVVQGQGDEVTAEVD